MFHFPKPRRVLERTSRIIFYPTKQISVLEKLTLRIPAMQNQRKSQSSLFSDIAVAIQLMVKAAAARRRELLSIWCVPWHCAAPEKGPAAGAMLAPSSTQSWDCRSCWRVTLGAKAAWVSVLLWGVRVCPFSKAPYRELTHDNSVPPHAEYKSAQLQSGTMVRERAQILPVQFR